VALFLPTAADDRTPCVALAVTVAVALVLPAAADERAAQDRPLGVLTDAVLGLTVLWLTELGIICSVAAALVAVVAMVGLPCSSGGSVVVVTTAPT